MRTPEHPPTSPTGCGYRSPRCRPARLGAALGLLLAAAAPAPAQTDSSPAAPGQADAAETQAARTDSAGTAYVIDRLTVGIHADKTLNSPILKMVPTGTPLDVLERDGDFARVQTPDGTEGWVDTSYLMSEQPATLKVVALEAEHRETAAALRDARAEIEALREQIAELRGTSAGAEPRAGEEGSDAAPITAGALREMQRLAEENRRLKQRLDELSKSSAGGGPGNPGHTETAPGAQPDPEGPWAALVPSLPTRHWILLGFVALLAFALGAYAVDWDVRRRHGGFRV